MATDVNVQRRITNVQLDVHPVERALIISYELDCVISDQDDVASDTAFLQRKVRIKNLAADSDIVTLAEEICEKNSQLVSKAQNLREVEQLLNYLRKRREKSGISNLREEEVQRISMVQLDKYIEDLYEDESKVQASSMILFLAQNTENLEVLTKHEVLLGALTRTLREEGHRNYSLASNILNFFQCLSRFVTFAGVISDHKVGSLTMELLQGEMHKTQQVLDELEESQLSNDIEAFENLTKSYTAVLRKQDTMLTAAFSLLLNMTSDPKNEMRIVNKGIVPLLTSCLDRKSRPLLLVVLTFLVKLSAYKENIEDIAQTAALDKICQIIPSEETEIATMTLKLIHNLSFNADTRCRLVSCGVLPKLVSHLAATNRPSMRSQVLKILILIAEDSRFLSHFAYTDAAHVVLGLILETEGPCSSELTLIAQSLASSLSCAQIICERNGLKFLIKRALKYSDVGLLRVVRNISMHDGPSKQLFLEHVEKIADRLEQQNRLSTPTNNEVATECMRILANLDQVEFLQVLNNVTKSGILIWMNDQLQAVSSQLERCTTEEEFVLDLLLVCATFAENDPEIALDFIGKELHGHLLSILNACQENDTMVVHVLWVFYCILRHKSSREAALAKTPVAGYFLDLLNDANKGVQLMCDAALDLLAEHGQDWASQVRLAKFGHFNAQWMDMVEHAEASFKATREAPDTTNLYEGMNLTLDES
ncbi:kinesin-associated protein 3 [Galendromus occidentalis]|uniref:Kinesin-associated protein 3 n=1 Tax=Galendromus occidentalis TaxID=34638 RepID=A0AAJ7SE47_9ACAR|nr:kinesin-associated protein 3 [Galendromus occidentalis]